MAETQATQPVENIDGDTAVTRVSYVDTLPPELARDSYVRFLASTCDQYRDERDEAREQRNTEWSSHSETRSAHLDAIQRNLALNATNAELRADLATERGKRYNPENVYRVCLTVLMVAALAMFAVLAVWS